MSSNTSNVINPNTNNNNLNNTKIKVKYNTNTAPPRSTRSSPSNLDPEYHWLTTAQTPVFSRTQIYTQGVVMPVRAPPRRKSTSTSSSSTMRASSS